MVIIPVVKFWCLLVKVLDYFCVVVFHVLFHSFFATFFAMDYSVVAGDWKMAAIVGKWGNCGFFRCCVGFFISFDSLMSWNPDDCGVCIRLIVI